MSNQFFLHIINGDIDAYSELYKEYFRKFHNYGRKFTSNNFLIEDSIQEVFLDLWSRREKLAHIESPNFYLYSSFRYILFKKIKQHNKIVFDDTDRGEIEFSVENIIINKELSDELKIKLQEAIKSLTGRQLEAIFLRFYENLSYKEVASILNISVKATYKIMARSVAVLKGKITLCWVIF